MSSLTHSDRGSIAPLADREVGGESPVDDLVDTLRSAERVARAEVRAGDAGEDVFEDAGDETLRDYGYSTRFGFSYDAISTAGFSETELVTVYARENAILLVSAEQTIESSLREAVAVDLTLANVPEAVADILAAHDATVRPETIMVTADGTLSFSLDAPTAFERIDERNLREFGSGQTSLTLPKGALEVAGLDAEDVVAVSATPGAVLLVGRN